MGFYFLMSWLNFRALFLIRFASPLKLDRLSLPAPTIMSPIRRGFSVAAMNPCRCGYLGDPARACSRAPACGQNYQAKISGPMMDRFDLII